MAGMDDHSVCEAKERALRAALAERVKLCEEMQDELDALTDEVLRLRDRDSGGW